MDSETLASEMGWSEEISRLFDQLKWLEDAGFADVNVHWMLAGHAVFGARKARRV